MITLDQDVHIADLPDDMIEELFDAWMKKAIGDGLLFTSPIASKREFLLVEQQHQAGLTKRVEDFELFNSEYN